MQARAQIARQLRREHDQGVLRLPGFESIDAAEPTPQGKYDHVSPWEPPALVDDRLDFEDQTDPDPDDIDPDTWAEELEDD